MCICRGKILRGNWKRRRTCLDGAVLLSDLSVAVSVVVDRVNVGQPIGPGSRTLEQRADP